MNLCEFFCKFPKVAIAFSGGVDSSYLLYVAKQYAKEISAYYVKSSFQSQCEMDDALHFANELNVQMQIISLDILADKNIITNPCDRCYYCKRQIFTAIKRQASGDGFSVLLDGTNASDEVNARPGVKALNELSVLSPLRLCGLTKEKIRCLSQNAGLSTWSKPSNSCLATRISTGQAISEALLRRTETAENYLFSKGFSNFRIRTVGENAKLEIMEQQIPLLLKNRQEILDELKRYYGSVYLDLEVRNEN